MDAYSHIDEKCKIDREVKQSENEIPPRCFIKTFKTLKDIACQFAHALLSPPPSGAPRF